MTSYRALMVAFVAAVAISAGTPPSAKPRQATHTIAWYAQNHEAREEMLRRCRNDMGLSRSVECLNAEAGGNSAYSNALSRRAWGRS